MKLYADSREPPGLLKLLNARVNNMETGNLDIGDFIIKDDNENIVMIFERKTIADLISSIKDGRYREQSFRLSQLPLNNHHIFYIIEGNFLDYALKNTETTKKILYSAMFSLSYKKGFSLLHANGLLDTAEYIIRFMGRYGEGDKVFPSTPRGGGEILLPQHMITSEISPPLLGVDGEKSQPGGIGCLPPSPKYSSVIKTTKKSNITKENIGEIMLAQIPGVSMNAAQSLMVEYKTIKNLMSTLENDENCLNDFQIECKSGSRKISKAAIKSLKEYL